MQPCSREIQAMNTLFTPSVAHDSQIQNSPFDNDDFLDQIFSTPTVSSSWVACVDPTSVKSSSSPSWDPPPLTSVVDETPPLDTIGCFYPTASHLADGESAVLASKLRQHHQIGGSTSRMTMEHQQQIMTTMPLSMGRECSHNDVVDGSVRILYNGFAGGSLNGGSAPTAPLNQPHHFHHPQGAQDYGGVINQGQVQADAHDQPQASASTTTPTPSQTKPKVRARRGQATDPHSIAERLRRERIAERMKGLQELVPNSNKTDKASMLDEIIDYVRFLQLQVKVLSMSRLGGAPAAAAAAAAAAAPPPLVSEGGEDCVRGNQASSTSNDSLIMTEHQVAKLMDEDMGSAMQYLQGKGLCLMPISLATAISTATCHSSRNNPLINNNSQPPIGGTGERPSSPNMSVLTMQYNTLKGNGAADGSVVKDAASVSKP